MTLPANVTRFLFEIPSLNASQGQELRVVGFEGANAVSDLFYCQIDVASENAAIDIEALIGKSARLTLFDERNPQYLHGEIQLARRGESGHRYTLYSLLLVPKLAFLGYRKNQRIFQNQSVVDTIKAVFKDSGIEGDHVEWSITSTYASREYCTQYGETDLEFVNRLMQEEGLYYFFHHKHDRHVMVISDNKSCFQNIEGESAVRYKERTGMVASEESIFEFAANAQIHTGKITLRDYGYQKSRLRLEQSKQSSNYTELEHYRYENNFTDPVQGKHFAEVRLQAQTAQSETASGKTDCPRMVVGRRFSVKDHPCRSFNKEYTLLRTEFVGKQPQSLGEGAGSEGFQFTVSFKAIPATVDYRSPLSTPVPTIEGVQTAFVTGPAGEEIYTDELGRVKVQFHWDREGAYDENSTCWLRVCQTIAGNQWGAMVLPRVGQEVLVSFLNGNPDRPIVTRVLYNGANQPPYSLPQNKTKTLFKSHSSPGGGGFNEIQLEDKKGKEKIYLRGEKDLDIYIQNEWKEWVGKEQHLSVGKSSQADVGKDLHSSIKGNYNLKTGAALSETSGQNSQIKISGSHIEQAGQDISLKAGMTLVLEAGVELTLKAGGGLVKLDPSGVTIKGPMVKINTGGMAQAGKPASPVTPAEPTDPEKGDGPGKVNKSAVTNNFVTKDADSREHVASIYKSERQALSKAETTGPVLGDKSSRYGGATNQLNNNVNPVSPDNSELYSATVLLAVQSALEQGRNTIQNPDEFASELKKALNNSRSESEALGKAGMEQAKRRLGHQTDPRYVDRYHGPDDMTNKDGRLAEWEAKGNKTESTAVAKDDNGYKQGSSKKNAKRAHRMTTFKSKKVDQHSNRQGGPYKKDEIDLWQDISDRDGNKIHISVHTNTDSGQVKVYERKNTGDIHKNLNEFKMENFTDIKQAVEGFRYGEKG